MPREYQRKKNNPYRLPDNLYKTVKYQIKDYDRLKEERENIMLSSPLPPDGMPKGSCVGCPTEEKALKCQAISRVLDSIDNAIKTVPEEYRREVFNESKYGGGFPIYASRSTYWFWKQRFYFHTAINLKLI